MKLDLNNWYKPEIDRKKLKELSKRRDWPALLHFIIYFGTLITSGYLAYITRGNWISILFFFIYVEFFILDQYLINSIIFINLVKILFILIHL